MFGINQMVSEQSIIIVSVLNVKEMGRCEDLSVLNKKQFMARKNDKEFKVLYWPPDSPEFNGIRYLWDVLEVQSGLLGANYSPKYSEIN